MIAEDVAGWYRAQRNSWAQDGPVFHNVGWWESATPDLPSAQQVLIEGCLAFVDSEATFVVDVACGPGGTTIAIADHCPDAQVIGVDFALPEHLPRTDRVTFVSGDALDLPFADSSVDAVVCIEAAQHFDTRAAFLLQARRVLRPGGRLVLTDLLVDEGTAYWDRMIPSANIGVTVEDYRGLVSSAGFTEVFVQDVTESTWTPYWDRVGSHLVPAGLHLPVSAYVLAIGVST